jgi:hypothetical protein
MRGRYPERERSQGSSYFHIVKFTLAGIIAPGYRRAQASRHHFRLGASEILGRT